MPETDTTVAALMPLTDRQEQKVYNPDQMWSDDFAVKVAVQDFSSAEQYRTQNCDLRWRNANELYVAWVQQKYWEGTRMPRASMGVFVAFEQIESMLPKILSAIFSDNPWFQADPVGQTTAKDATLWRDTILDQLDRTRVREVFRRCIKSGLLYGNGIMKLSWTLKECKYLRWVPRMQPKAAPLYDPLQGMGQQFSGFERVLDKQTYTEIENRPELEYVSLADFYIDPNCNSPQPRDSRFRIRRKLCTVEDLKQLRGTTPWKIPDDATLLDWARYKPSTQADATKSTEELYRLASWYPTNDQTVDPGGKRVEVLEYETDERLVLVANRCHALLNVPNSYGCCTYYDAFYADVLDRFYAMGVCDIVEGEQRLQGALLNGRLDELALALHRPMVKKLGVKTPTYALRARPGQIWEAEDPKNDYQFMQIPDITANAYIETNASQMRVQKNTGQSDLYSSGVPSAGGNSASRTATGIGAQVQASGSRIQYIVENLEDTFIEPMLNDLVKLNQMFPPIGTPEAEVIALTRVQLSMRASAKMQARMGLLQTFPLIMQTLGNPAFIQELAQSGQSPDWSEIMRILEEMTGYKKRADLIRQLSPEEMQARQQKQQMPEMIKAKMQEQRIMGQQTIQREKLQASHQASLQMAQLDAEKEKLLAQFKAQLEIQAGTQEVELKRQELLLQAKIEQEKLVVEREKIAAQANVSDNRVLVDLTKALIAAQSDEETGEATVIRNADGLIEKVIKAADSGAHIVNTVERDADGNVIRVVSSREG